MQCVNNSSTIRSISGLCQSEDQSEVTEDYYSFNEKIKTPHSYDELEHLFIKLITGYREERDLFFSIDDNEFNITQNSKIVILRKLNSPLKNFSISSSYEYNWDTRKRLTAYINDLKNLT